MNVELALCPWCAILPEIETFQARNGDTHVWCGFITCQECRVQKGFVGDFSESEDHVRELLTLRWNTRAAPGERRSQPPPSDNVPVREHATDIRVEQKP